jgi:hypothetical protein
VSLIPKFLSRLGHDVDIPALKRAYLRMPDEVRVDLAEFCHAAEPVPMDSNLFSLGRAAGRRDVWLRIAQFLNLSDAELFDLWRGQSVTRIVTGEQ